MPQAIKDAISDSYPDVTWVDPAGADSILEEVDDAQAFLLAISPLTELAPGVQGIEVGVTHGAFHGQIIQFQWNGTEWMQPDSEDTGSPSRASFPSAGSAAMRYPGLRGIASAELLFRCR